MIKTAVGSTLCWLSPPGPTVDCCLAVPTFALASIMTSTSASWLYRLMGPRT